MKEMKEELYNDYELKKWNLEEIRNGPQYKYMYIKSSFTVFSKK